MMNKFFLSVLCFALSTTFLHAQTAEDLLKSFTKKHKKDTSSLSTTDVISGLKEALNNGVNAGTVKLSSVNGFFANAAVKILMPPEAQKVENKLRMIGMGKLVDNAILSMNRAAEDASKSAARYRPLHHRSGNISFYRESVAPTADIGLPRRRRDHRSDRIANDCR